MANGCLFKELLIILTFEMFLTQVRGLFEVTTGSPLLGQFIFITLHDFSRYS